LAPFSGVVDVRFADEPVATDMGEVGREVLDALLAVEFGGVEELRAQARDAIVGGACTCGCPSIDFFNRPGVGMRSRVNAAIRGSNDSIFLFTVGGRLAGIEYVGVSDTGDPSEFPDPSLLVIEPV
jgi:hypothetical protein